jgi:hypothetical protein
MNHISKNVKKKASEADVNCQAKNKIDGSG